MAQPRSSGPFSSTRNLILHSVLPLSLTTFCVSNWLRLVSRTVPEPYLDEFFHAPQAQVYWAGLWRTWDPKITTPPGLYIYSYILLKIYSVFVNVPVLRLSLLRLSNQVLLIVVPSQLRRHYPSYFRADLPPSSRILHPSLNIILFPLLFFFSALYYTDVLSALVVNEAYSRYACVERNEDSGQGQAKRGPKNCALRSGLIFLLGVVALLCRQTNIFWVAVFLGGLQAVKTLKDSGRKLEKAVAEETDDSTSNHPVYDPPMQDADLEDYAKAVLSLGVAALIHIPHLISDLVPYLALLATFAGFVVWNGAVVLGDKENHIASIHLPQMLYIWPCIVFFSWPVLIPTIANMSPAKLPRISVAVPVMGFMLAVVHLNTIVHPFTLADNRHYVFYVFRLLLRRPLVKYAVVPVYFVCAWLVIASLGQVPGHADSTTYSKVKRRWKQIGRSPKELPKPYERVRTSFVLVWLTATTLSLVTAPLVEPRYFIVPWLVWRVNVPVESWYAQFEQDQEPAEGIMQRVLKIASANRLWIETVWYLLVNIITCYVFLYRGFEWPQEPGKVQRFMW